MKRVRTSSGLVEVSLCCRSLEFIPVCVSFNFPAKVGGVSVRFIQRRRRRPKAHPAPGLGQICRTVCPGPDATTRFLFRTSEPEERAHTEAVSSSLGVPQGSVIGSLHMLKNISRQK